MSTWWVDWKKLQKKKNSRWLFFNPLYPWTCTWTGRINLKICLGYDMNYLSIGPFMRHPWFPTRKASKLTFICFQLQFFSPCIVLNNWSWKQINVSFEAFRVGNQGWRIKGQMLRYLISYPKNIFRFIRPVHVHLKTDKVDFKKKPPRFFFFLHFFAIHSSSRHEKCCQMLERVFCLFQCSRNIRWAIIKSVKINK